MPRILVIDDDENVRDILRRMLTRQGYEVEEAENGERGLRLYRERRADLVITDIVMPEKEGLETIMEMRQEDPEALIIVVSGGGERGSVGDYLFAAREFGARYTFEKPIPKDELLAAVRELVGAGKPAAG
jgi:DNA-binding response OmpR family regulator